MGLEEEVGMLRPDIALLPVNGRRADLSTNGVAGNFDLMEAIAIARAVGCGDMVAHHYGLFGFNSVAPAAIDAARLTDGLYVHRAREGFVLESAAATAMHAR
ncbi:conserved hypothetical protein [Mesorhizobium metallidurans STM 2683]|uniref:Uncharacterized protein n=2 Tax=Mesorhizobium metallidurans TaxID=489722 RepID=M5EWM1_9HYPH|nr:conserved hypothetical protein [Mesorhizobium metallidurans STM 2683]